MGKFGINGDKINGFIYEDLLKINDNKIMRNFTFNTLVDFKGEFEFIKDGCLGLGYS
jgi:hypothetical protein